MSDRFFVKPVGYKGIEVNTQIIPDINEVPAILAYLREIDAERDVKINMDIAVMDRRIRADMTDARIIWLLFWDEHKYVGMCSLQAVHNPTFEHYDFHMDNFHLTLPYRKEVYVRKFYRLIKNWVILNDGVRIFSTFENSNKKCRDLFKKLNFEEKNVDICVDQLIN